MKELSSVIGIDSTLGNNALDCLGTGGLIRPVCVQPLAIKCRVEPTVSGGLEQFEAGKSSYGTAELETEL
jgi:hypothetical protein